MDERSKPVIRLASRVFGERVLQLHSPVGYDTMLYINKSTRVGLIVYSYADSCPHRASTNSPVAIDGKHSRITDRVSVDTTAVELEALKKDLGVEVGLWGGVINISETVEVAGMIPYEVPCNIKCAKLTYIE